MQYVFQSIPAPLFFCVFLALIVYAIHEIIKLKKHSDPKKRSLIPANIIAIICGILACAIKYQVTYLPQLNDKYKDLFGWMAIALVVVLIVCLGITTLKRYKKKLLPNEEITEMKQKFKIFLVYIIVSAFVLIGILIWTNIRV